MVGNASETTDRRTDISCVSLKEKDYLEGTVIGRKIILKWITKIYDWR